MSLVKVCLEAMEAFTFVDVNDIPNQDQIFVKSVNDEIKLRWGCFLPKLFA